MSARERVAERHAFLDLLAADDFVVEHHRKPAREIWPAHLAGLLFPSDARRSLFTLSEQTPLAVACRQQLRDMVAKPFRAVKHHVSRTPDVTATTDDAAQLHPTLSTKQVGAHCTAPSSLKSMRFLTSCHCTTPCRTVHLPCDVAEELRTSNGISSAVASPSHVSPCRLGAAKHLQTSSTRVELCS